MKTVKSVQWHEDVLLNMKDYLLILKKRKKYLQEEIDNVQREIDIKHIQIQCAKKEHKESFDGSRYKIKEGGIKC